MKGKWSQDLRKILSDPDGRKWLRKNLSRPRESRSCFILDGKKYKIVKNSERSVRDEGACGV